MPSLRRAAAEPARALVAREIAAGLAREQKELNPKYFYDAHGSRLFEEITTLDEYYPTRTERALLARLMPRWIPEAAPRSLVELGAGSGEKTRLVLDSMVRPGHPVTYVPIDVSAEFLADTARRFRADYPGLRVLPAVADITRSLELPPGLPRPALYIFLGSTIGNFENPEAIALLRRVAAAMQPGDSFLLGADLVKDPAVLERAYNDGRGITAAFNLNILRVINRVAGANFATDGFRHRAFYNAGEARIEMHLESLRDQVVELPGVAEVRIRRGETIRSEISRKFTADVLQEMFRSAGLLVQRTETDPRGWYALVQAGLVSSQRRSRVRHQGAALTPLRDDLRVHAFALAGENAAPDRVGAEIEFLVLNRENRPNPLDQAAGATLPFLRRHGAPLGWVEERSPKGTPRFRLPGQGTLSFEPGGQVELSTVAGTPSEVLGILEAVVPALRSAALDSGLRLLDTGIDPHNSIAASVPQLFAERYTRMLGYFETIGPAGARMMRQTAAFHLNFDFGSQNMLRWRVLNASAPVLTAIFANSRRYAGSDSGFQSARAMTWRELDPARTGILPAGPVAEDEYLDFALGAPMMLRDPLEGRYLTFLECWNRGAATLEDWHEHQTTLFPDVRPRGYLEFRAIDALPAEAYPAPLVLLAGILYDGVALATANDLLGSPDPGLLVPGASLGLGHPGLAGLARDLVAIGLEGARRLGPDQVQPSHLEQAREFFTRHTLAARSPADFTA